MKWIPRLLALFVVLPAIELALLLQFHSLTGFWATVGVILGTGILGSFLAKREGLGAWQRLKTRIGEAGLPGKELLDGVIILIAGALLVTPGLLTDVVGFLGLIPASRAFIRTQISKRVARHQAHSGFLFHVGPLSAYPPSTPHESDMWQGEARPSPRHADE